MSAATGPSVARRIFPHHAGTRTRHEAELYHRCGRPGGRGGGHCTCTRGTEASGRRRSRGDVPRRCARREALGAGARAGLQAGPETIKGETKPAIYMHPNSRLTFHKVTIPDSGHLRRLARRQGRGLGQAAATACSSASASPTAAQYEELVNQHVDPANNPSDRRWIPQDIDLSAYAGQQVELIFNTQTASRGRPANPANDWAVWGAPAHHRQALSRLARRALARLRHHVRRLRTMHVPLLDLKAQFAPLRDAVLGGDHARVRRAAVHPRPRSRALRARGRGLSRRAARDRRVVGHRRAARRADGARHRARRRGRDPDLFVLRHRRLRRARRRAGRCSSTSIR